MKAKRIPVVTRLVQAAHRALAYREIERARKKTKAAEEAARSKRSCPECGGDGVLGTGLDSGTGMQYVDDCWKCDGTGQVSITAEELRARILEEGEARFRHPAGKDLQAHGPMTDPGAGEWP